MDTVLAIKNKRNARNWKVWISIFLISATLILLQGALTRILSASSGYHATFFVISSVMLGLASSGIGVYRCVKDGAMNHRVINRALCQASIYSAISYLFYAHVLMKIFLDDWTGMLFILSSIVFYFPFERCGFAISGILYLERENVNWIYWGDLLGASVAAALLVPVFNIISSPLVFIFSGLVLVFSAWLIISSVEERDLFSSNSLIIFTIFFVACLMLPRITFLPFPHSFLNSSLEWEEWNSQARVAVFNEYSETDKKHVSAGWGITKNFNGKIPQFKWLNIDSDAGTQIISSRNKKKGHSLDYLTWDVTGAAYQLKSDNLDSVFIIGGGGGRDIVTASIAGSKNIHVAELNPLVKKAVNETYADFSGRPYFWDNVRLTMGEARNILSRSDGAYDVIQMSMIDTFAASVSGSFALSENSLYTVEAFKLAIEKLNSGGVFSLSRWWQGGSHGETARAILMLLRSLEELGIHDPSENIIVLYSEGELSLPVTTMLVSKTAFSSDTIIDARSLANAKGFEVIWPNKADETRGLADIFKPNFDISQESIYDLSLSTDDRPFFFNSKRLISSWIESIKRGEMSIGSNVTLVFLMTVVVLILGSKYLVYDPAKRIVLGLHEESKLSISQMRGLVIYFSSIGIGFMIIEVAMLQRFSVFLGHPHMSLSVVLSSILFFSSIGSYISRYVLKPRSNRMFLGVLSILLLDITFKAFVMPDVLNFIYQYNLVIRVLIACFLIAPGALVMGMFLPFGFRILNERGKGDNLPLAWAVNGIASIIGSTLGALLAMSFGYTCLLIFSMLVYSLVFLGQQLMRS